MCIYADEGFGDDKKHCCWRSFVFQTEVAGRQRNAVDVDNALCELGGYRQWRLRKQLRAFFCCLSMESGSWVQGRC